MMKSVASTILAAVNPHKAIVSMMKTILLADDNISFIKLHDTDYPNYQDQPGADPKRYRILPVFVVGEVAMVGSELFCGELFFHIREIQRNW